MPFWEPYESLIEPGIADLDNAPGGGMAGAITAALFLKRFAPKGPWAHLDIFAWNARGRPGSPAGAEAQAIRGLYRMLRERFA